MASAVRLRSDSDGAALGSLARASRDAKQVRRLLALALIYECVTRSEAAQTGGVTLQIVRECVLRLNTDEAAGLLIWKPGLLQDELLPVPWTPR